MPDTPDWRDYLADAQDYLRDALGRTYTDDAPDVPEQLYAEACTEQLQDEIRDVWNRGDTRSVEKYHDADLRVEGMFDVVGSDHMVGRDGYRRFAQVAHAATDDLDLTLTGEPEWKGITTEIPDRAATVEDYYGRTAGSWVMTADLQGLPVELVFEGHGEHWWTPMVGREDTPRGAYAEVEWELAAVTLDADTGMQYSTNDRL